MNLKWSVPAVLIGILSVRSGKSLAARFPAYQEGSFGFRMVNTHHMYVPEF